MSGKLASCLIALCACKGSVLKYLIAPMAVHGPISGALLVGSSFTSIVPVILPPNIAKKDIAAFGRASMLFSVRLVKYINAANQALEVNPSLVFIVRSFSCLSESNFFLGFSRARYSLVPVSTFACAQVTGAEPRDLVLGHPLSNGSTRDIENLPDVIRADILVHVQLFKLLLCRFSVHFVILIQNVCATANAWWRSAISFR